MKHKHKWQFVKNWYTSGCINERAEFICECGEVKIVEIKRD